jgi:hypothetical protein
MDDLEASTLHGLKDRVTHVRAELTTTVESLRTYDVSHLGAEVEAMRVAVLADAEAALSAATKRAPRKAA